MSVYLCVYLLLELLIKLAKVWLAALFTALLVNGQRVLLEVLAEIINGKRLSESCHYFPGESFSDDVVSCGKLVIGYVLNEHKSPM